MPRVLIVEDNVDNYELVRFLLERAGHNTGCDSYLSKSMNIALFTDTVANLIARSSVKPKRRPRKKLEGDKE